MNAEECGLAWTFRLSNNFISHLQLAVANKIIIPAMAAMKFPQLEVTYSDGRTLKLPNTSNEGVVGADKLAIPKASLICLTFRANSQVFDLLILYFHDFMRLSLYTLPWKILHYGLTHPSLCNHLENCWLVI